jgi:hypothetical protein
MQMMCGIIYKNITHAGAQTDGLVCTNPITRAPA